jgi:hypothetical protein
MARYSDEEKRRSIAEARDLLADLAMFDDVLAVRELLQVEDPILKWKREAEQTKREQEQARAEMKAEEAQIIRQHQQAAERAARPEMPELLDAIAEFVVEFVRQKNAKLERRLDALETKERGVDDGDVIDLPSPLLRKRHDAA